MARMIPPQCPPETASEAERALFDAFGHGLDARYTVIHSLPWLSEDQRRLKEGECDFLLLHPRHGMLAIEAKSGEVRYDGPSRSWIRGDCEIVHDPFLQAERCAHELNRFLCDRLPAWRNAQVPFGHAVAFPGADRVLGEMPPHVRPELLILRSDLSAISERVEDLLCTQGKPECRLDEPTLRHAIEILLPRFAVVRSLAAELSDQERALFRLTRQQIDFFEGMLENPRLIVEGVAGSGKTVLARETAARLAERGEQVLLVCFNIPLAEALRRQLRAEDALSVQPGAARSARRPASPGSGSSDESSGSVDVFHFHGLCEHVVRETGGRWEVPPDGLDVFYNETAPELLCRALPQYRTRYSAVLVDEGQDFCDLWWVPLEELLEPRRTGTEPAGGVAGGNREGRFYVFLDRRQDIYRRSGRLPFEKPVHHLPYNCRNTASIARFVHHIGGVEGCIPEWMPEGVHPDVREVRSDHEEREGIRKLLHDLVHAQGLRVEQIVILGAHRFAGSVFGGNPRLGAFTVVDRMMGHEVPGQEAGGGSPFSRPSAPEIRYSTFHRFKGLESDCVILSGVGGEGWTPESESFREQLYVAASRAKALLYVFLRVAAVAEVGDRRSGASFLPLLPDSLVRRVALDVGSAKRGGG